MTSASSKAEQFVPIIRAFFDKVAHVVVQARVRFQPVLKEEERKESIWFNLRTDEVRVIRRDVETCCTDGSLPSGLTIDILFDERKTLVERWSLKLDTSVRINADGVYKRAVILFRSLYTQLRILPAFEVYKGSSKPLGIGLSFALSVEGKGLCFEDSAITTEFKFIPIDTPLGRLSLGVTYRRNVSTTMKSTLGGEPEESLSRLVISNYADPDPTPPPPPKVTSSPPAVSSSPPPSKPIAIPRTQSGLSLACSSSPTTGGVSVSYPFSTSPLFPLPFALSPPPPFHPSSMPVLPSDSSLNALADTFGQACHESPSAKPKLPPACVPGQQPVQMRLSIMPFKESVTSGGGGGGSAPDTNPPSVSDRPFDPIDEDLPFALCVTESEEAELGSLVRRCQNSLVDPPSFVRRTGTLPSSSLTSELQHCRALLSEFPQAAELQFGPHDGGSNQQI